MYFAVTPDVDQSTRVICLNTNWWSLLRNGPPEEDDPADQFSWFESELNWARKRGQKVIVVGHIPPAHSFFVNSAEGFSVSSQWKQPYNERYYEILQGNSDILFSQLFGHFHTDQFRLQMKRQTNRTMSRMQEPLGMILLAPGVCPNHGTNPAWRLVHRNKGEVLDYQQYSTRLYGRDDGVHKDLGTWDAQRLLPFQAEYNATEKFRVSALTTRNMFWSLWRRLTNNDASMYKYWILEEVEATNPPAFLLRCVIQENYVPDFIRKCAMDYIRQTQQHKAEEIVEYA
eukprot:Gregarina_sp_Poly_1__683@NODE_1163_length_4887_cov_131_620332_g798_i0_p1_GENE_NODE_1163_length_4887_cov_131_620332_g798_i0NODE_1163_length_4887_cov_131_620332_g798_i0_p1_ORF_typecomplete_len286_score23_35Metallophos/PF00149_28/0_00016Metallophos/PF00149_28/3_1e03CBM_20/PF00686_19/6_3e02CBM_20/PF00686_19/0_51_NODE_1163_length_4887_cov_131_620332_g798_i06741531